MKNLVNLILEKLEDEGRNGECERQLDIVVNKQDEFVKGFSKEKWCEYFWLECEIFKYHGMVLEHALEVAIKVLQEIYK